MEETNIAKPNKKSIKKNYLFNLIYQIFILIIPLVTTPYISRVLLADGVGQYSFTFSIQSYFVLIAALGFGYYAQREIANHQNDKKSQSIIFWEVTIIKILSVGFAVSLNLAFVYIGVYQTYKELMAWWTINIAAVALDITFLLQGNEDFGRIVGRNVLIKTIGVILVFILVKNNTDVWIYVLITSISTLLGNLSLWIYLPKYLSKISLKSLKPFRHFIPTLRLFLPTIATSIYTMLDKTLIGALINETFVAQEEQIVDGVPTVVSVVKQYSDLENGYYEQSEKIVKMCLAVVGALGTVMIPRNSKLYADNNWTDLKKNVYFATDYVWLTCIPMAAGLAAIAPNFVPWFFGAGFEKCILLIQVFTPLIIFIGFSNVLGLQYLIPTKRDKKFTIGILAGTFSNLALNCILIPLLWSYGAVIASLIAEFLVTLTMYLLIRKEISLKTILKGAIKPCLAGIIMFACVFIIQFFLRPKWYFTVLLIFIGIISYFVVLIALRETKLTSIINKVALFLRKKKNKINEE